MCPDMTVTPRTPARACLPLLPSGPGGVQRGDAARGVRTESTCGWLAWCEASAALRYPRPLEDSHSGLVRTLGKRVGIKPSRVRISHPPPHSRPAASDLAVPPLCRPTHKRSSQPRRARSATEFSGLTRAACAFVGTALTTRMCSSRRPSQHGGNRSCASPTCSPPTSTRPRTSCRPRWQMRFRHWRKASRADLTTTIADLMRLPEHRQRHCADAMGAAPRNSGAQDLDHDSADVGAPRRGGARHHSDSVAA